MSTKPVNHHKPWGKQQDSKLKTLAARNTPTRVIGIKLGRTPAAVQNRASAIGLSLKPTNQSPYNRRRK
jgi:hypothetical protein